MPILEFKCEECGKEKEEIILVVRVEPVVECECGNNMTRVMSSGTFRVGGSNAAEFERYSRKR